MHPADEALIAKYCAVIPKDFRHLLHNTASDTQIPTASLWIPLKVQLLQLGDVY